MLDNTKAVARGNAITMTVTTALSQWISTKGSQGISERNTATISQGAGLKTVMESQCDCQYNDLSPT